MDKETRDLLKSAIYQLKEKIKTATSREMVEQCTDSILEIATFLEQTKE